MFISVIIATYNRHDQLKRVLDGLWGQKTIGLFDYEIVIVDNNSHDGTRRVVLMCQNKFEGRLRYFFEPQRGKSRAINLGIQESQGDVLVFTDDDVILHERWLSNIYECYKKYEPDAIGGRVIPAYGALTPPWIKENAVKLAGAVVIYDHGQRTFQVKDQKERFIGANFSMKRSVLEEVGGLWDNIGPGTRIAVGEDAELFGRLLKSKKRLYYCGQALVWHPFDVHRMSLKNMAQWNMALGRYAASAALERGERCRMFGRIPRYLFRSIFFDFLRLFSAWVNRPKFFIAWRDLFYKMGVAHGYCLWRERESLCPR